MTALPTLDEVDRELARQHILDFIPWATKKWQPPKHLEKLLLKFEEAFRALSVIPDKAARPQFVVCHAPPRHGKTEALLHFIAWVLWQRPDICFSYTTYGDRLSRKKMRALRELLERIGVHLVTRNLNDLRTAEGGGVIAGGIKGPLVGEGINIAIIDDPIKNQVEAQSQTDRSSKEDWYDTGLTTRIEPGGSVFCFMHRWHPDDLAGYLIKTHKFEYLCFPAINGDGEALWPERWPATSFEGKKKIAHVWAALYQGQPRPRGDSVFDGCTTYTQLPKVYSSAFGVDLAYTKKTKADWSIAIRLLREERSPPLKPLFYVARVLRKQERVPQFRERCKRMHDADPGAPWRWYTSTTEQGVADLFDGEDGFPLEALIAKGDKLIRASPVAEAWNDGRVLVPESSKATWVEPFLTCVNGFTGVNDTQDDDVDALAPAYDLLSDGELDSIEEPAGEPQRMGIGASRM